LQHDGLVKISSRFGFDDDDDDNDVDNILESIMQCMAQRLIIRQGMYFKVNIVLESRIETWCCA
jgi:hypothetical protein